MKEGFGNGDFLSMGILREEPGEELLYWERESYLKCVKEDFVNGASLFL